MTQTNGTFAVPVAALCFLGLLLSGISVFAQSTDTAVAPANLSTQDVAYGSSTLQAGGYRIQEAYGSQHFPNQPLTITALRFRPDYFFGQAFSTRLANIQVNLSTTHQPAEQLNNVFAYNTGTNDTIVFSGALSISSQFSGPSEGPKAFDIVIPLTQQFIYNPAAGNLLLDIRNFSGSGASPLAGEFVNGDAASTVIGPVTSSFGSINTGIDALQVVYLSTNLPPPALLQLTRGPYLQSGTISNVVVRWRTQRTSGSRVQFGLGATNLAWEVADGALATEHIVTLTNLAPSTKYYYAIGAGPADGAGGTNIASGSNYFVFTLPVAAKPTRIWAIGDAGTVTQGQGGQQAVRDSYYAYAGKHPTDVWLMLGDNAYNSGLDTEYQAAVFDMYSQQLRSTILWPTIGNHDVGGAYFGIFTFPTHGEGGGLASGTANYYSFDYGNIHFVCLDSELSDPTSGGAMLSWLGQDLAANTRDWLIAFWHEPPYSHGTHNSDATSGADFKLTQMRQNAVPILESYGVDLVLGGHSHVYERSYLLNGHYGRSDTLSPSMILDSGSGRLEESGAYLKSDTGPAANQGAVYVVAGSSGWTMSASVDHPAMFADPGWGGAHGLNQLGSMVIDINGSRLDAKFLRESGSIDDHFTIIKGAGSTFRLATLYLGGGGSVAAQWRSTAGHRYQLEKSPTLENPSWTPASTVMTATGTTMQWSGSVGSGAQRFFFRVVDVTQ